jgi:exopolysaccharide biosynthesis protein
VASIAERRGALAAVNAGFFILADGRPAGILKAGGKIKGWSNRPRGAVGILSRSGGSSLIFDRVTLTRPDDRDDYRTRLGSDPATWARAPDIVGGAGLLILDGREIDDWTEEELSRGFDTTRHPRTMIGTGGDGAMWLVTVDGRQPELSLGMTFEELKTLARRIGLRSALNLDGGGSTTMVVKGGRIVNHPSDPTGPRPVSDAILVLSR